MWRQRLGDPARAGEGIVVGVVDSGFTPESPSFAALPTPRPDQSVINAKWHGTCDPGPQQPVTCNNKVIGARWYDLTGQAVTPGEFRSPRDFNGHGTQVASVAAGNHNVAAVARSVRVGELSGVAPAARIAVYKTQWHQASAAPFGFQVDILAAIEDAVADGVDVLNLSLGDRNDAFDPMDEALLNAAAAGVFVAASAGNDGPGPATLDHANPWTTTVAASTQDIGFTKTLRLGNGTTFTGPGPGPAVASSGLVDAATAGVAGATPAEAEQCVLNKLDPAKVTGKIVLCANGGAVSRVAKGFAVKQAGGVGMVLYNPTAGALVPDYHFVPSVHVGQTEGAAIKSYIGGTASPTASFTASVANFSQRAPAIADSSSRGPGLSTGGDMLKPDIAAPGVEVLAATAPRGVLAGDTAIPVTGTSFAAPEIAGVAALLRSKNPTWSPMAVKSAMMTTATQRDNTGAPIPALGGNATPFDMDAGEVRPGSAFDPGLVYDSEPNEWRRFVCGTGQPIAFCPTYGSMEPSDLNYPSIASGDVPGVQTIMRRVVNVTNTSSTYTASVQAPPGFSVTVTPSSFTIPARGLASYTVKFVRTTAAFGQWAFGALTWSDAAGHAVRSPLAVRAAGVVAPAEATYAGTSGAPSVQYKAGFTGTLTARTYGLAAQAVSTHPVQGETTTFDEFNPTTGPGVTTTTVQVPSGTRLLRLGTLAADYAAGEDVDLFVYDSGGNLVGLGAVESATETVTLFAPPAGTYTVYIVQFAAPPGAPNQNIRLYRHLVGSAPGSLTGTPTSRSVTAGLSYTVTLCWSGLATGVRYLGLLEYLEGTTVVGRTVVKVTT